MRQLKHFAEYVIAFLMTLVLVVFLIAAFVCGFLAENLHSAFEMGWHTSDETFPNWIEKLKTRLDGVTPEGRENMKGASCAEQK